MRRTQIYLEDEQAVRLDHRAARAGTTRSEVIREAINAFLGPGGADWATEWQGAVVATTGIAPDVADDHVERLRQADAGRLSELES